LHQNQDVGDGGQDIRHRAPPFWSVTGGRAGCFRGTIARYVGENKTIVCRRCGGRDHAKKKMRPHNKRLFFLA
jgi:hypothetical protein